MPRKDDSLHGREHVRLNVPVIAISSSPRPITSRARSSTVISTGPIVSGSAQPGPPARDVSATTLRTTTEPPVSAAAAALSTLHENAQRPAMSGHSRSESLPSPPVPVVRAVPSAPAVPTRSNSAVSERLFPVDRVQLTLYTYKPATVPTSASQPSPLPSHSAFSPSTPSLVLFSYMAIPWSVRPGDYLEIRRIRRPDVRAVARTRGMGGEPQARLRGEALKGVIRNAGRDGYIFRAGQSASNVPASQIQVPETVAVAFKLQHRTDVEVVRVSEFPSIIQ